MSAILENVRAEAATSTCWRALRELARQVRLHAGEVRSASMLIADEPRAAVNPVAPAEAEGLTVSVAIGSASVDDMPPAAAGETRYQLEDLIVLRPLVEGNLPASAAEMIDLYLPYCLAPIHARQTGRAFAVSHFAQSLDGRIATSAGDARWIGCEENRLHAHRMRALCDGILIGSTTLRTDRPALTVRHAEGADPIRVVLGGADDIACLERAGPGKIVLIDDGPGPSSAQVEHVVLPRTDRRIATAAILQALYRAGMMSVYIEGGATTTSMFLAEGNIDVLQLHMSPMIIGPGVSSFSIPAVRSVDDSVRFARHLFRFVGDGMMFVGRVHQ